MATRLYTPERFSMTAGVNVPFDLALSSVSGSALKRPTGAFSRIGGALSGSLPTRFGRSARRGMKASRWNGFSS